ncbi:hypothetical protein DT594_05960 [Halopseudomonas laoshanensis]|uniref:DUF4145 domain-containing protein n=1 Tax=Halopseudomonas laoshanensis TaxID=2268758 RepID=A0A7V7GWU5_9GAMM|nr:hypothetical protein [Halopseudomonas laoshanensis]KAA0696860.1 hypothetical protein DT594_05960 [Halopseudomonas laoshanensis]
MDKKVEQAYKEMTLLYLKDEIFSWYPRTESGDYAKQDGWNRPYDYLDIAYKIIETHSSSFELIDCVSNLKRAIDHRIKKISTDYQFKSMNRFGLPKESLQKLEALGLAKPAIIKTITSIRNVVEHQFEDPPGVDRCSELADFTWYFLKSTDGVSRNIPNTFLLSNDFVSGYDDEFWLCFSIGDDKLWQGVSVYGWVKASHLSLQQTSELKINLETLQIRGESERTEIDHQVLAGLNGDAPLFVRGQCCFTDSAYVRLIHSYFSADRHL